MMQGKVFDIRRFSTHDGDGIRTTVFLKGCPLRCVWCQNPEGIDSQIYPMYLPNKCIHCGTCLELSKKGGVSLEHGEIRLCRNKADEWQKIVKECPAEAIMMDSKIYTAEQLVEEVLKDEVFFRRGGGVTLSGGEPLLQGKFAIEVLRLLHDRKIHTAVETSLSVPLQTVKEVLPYLDLIYADMKIADEGGHKKYVGTSNVLIKKNLEYILVSGFSKKAVIRTPLIPEFTATEDNLSAIASFLSGICPEVKYELLNYNPLAEAKYRLVDRDYCFKENPKMYTKDQMIRFGEIVKSNGIKNLIMEI